MIPANTYTGQTQDVQGAAVVNYLVTRAGLSDDLVYQMIKGVFESRDELVAAHQAARDIKLELAMQGMPIPMHPGAEKYLREKGVLK
jgi:TRAP transporter TAXI family solute receptor